jgi:hypothetical protein
MVNTDVAEIASKYTGGQLLTCAQRHQAGGRCNGRGIYNLPEIFQAATERGLLRGDRPQQIRIMRAGPVIGDWAAYDPEAEDNARGTVDATGWYDDEDEDEDEDSEEQVSMSKIISLLCL